MNLFLRPPEKQDIEALTQLHFYMWNDFYKHCLPVTYSLENYTINQCRQKQLDMFEGLKDTEKEFALVAIDKDNGKLAAICYVNQNDRPPEHDLYIPGYELELQRLYIWPEYRHKNLGGKLAYALHKWAQERHYYSAFWWAIDQNEYSFIHGKRAKTIKQMERDYSGTILNLTAYGMEL
jgi:GNAT superfamily N-acetyltransferase